MIIGVFLKCVRMHHHYDLRGSESIMLRHSRKSCTLFCRVRCSSVEVGVERGLCVVWLQTNQVELSGYYPIQPWAASNSTYNPNSGCSVKTNATDQLNLCSWQEAVCL